ncbi:MAG: hypothetical protein ABL919_13035 [Methylococcales bacterium]|nr:hypothetical protein [Methylococcaceae bacterium]
MNISLSTSANTLINHAQRKSADAAQTIAALPIQKDEVGSAEYNATDLIKPVLSLKGAELEAKIAAKMLETDKAATGSLLDIRA